MPEYREIKPVHPQLKEYVLSYLHISGRGFPYSKVIVPKPAIHLTFDFNNMFLINKKAFRSAISGIFEYAYSLHLAGEEADRLIIRFAPYGLSRFMSRPLSELTNQVTAPEIIWGESVENLYHRLAAITCFEQRVELIENWLLTVYREPLPVDKYVFQAADILLKTGGNLRFPVIRGYVPLSTKQLERKFKQLIGIDIQTYIRICRVDKAKYLLSNKDAVQLTSVGYDAGYYDQAHFSREFKRLTGTNPKKYVPCEADRRSD